MPKENYYSNYRLLIGKIKIKFNKVKYNLRNIKLDLCALQNGDGINAKFKVAIKGRFDTFSDVDILFEDVMISGNY